MASNPKHPEGFTKVERILESYSAATRKIELYERAIEELNEEDSNTLRASSYDSPRVQTSRISRIVEETTIKKLNKMEQLENNLEKWNQKKLKLDKFIEWLNFRTTLDQYDVVRKHYCQGLSIPAVSKDVGKSTGTIKKIREKAIIRLLQVYNDFGEDYNLK